MPELPEVETVARRLDPRLRNRRIRDITLLDPKLDHPELPTLVGHRVAAATRLGKQVLLHLIPPRGRRPRVWLAVHLRMTGQLFFASRPEDQHPRHLRARFTLDRGQLLFTDVRRFGRLLVLHDPAEAAPDGVDPTTDAFTPRVLADLLTGSRQPLKPWLLRQDRLVGLGNIYASEILFAARIHPGRPAGSLSPAEIRRLHRATRHILHKAIQACGTTFYDIEAGRTLSGTFKEQLAVYGQHPAPCPRCGQPIQRATQVGRSTYFCEGCQGEG